MSPKTLISVSGCTVKATLCSVLESETLEEANSDLVNWVKQRSRWYKGSVQTFLIHLRHGEFLDEMKPRGAFHFVMFVGADSNFLAVFEPIILGNDACLVLLPILHSLKRYSRLRFII